MDDLAIVIEHIGNMRLTEGLGGRQIEFSEQVTRAQLTQLLYFLRERRLEFALHDKAYPSPSDPGAYISYSCQKAYKTFWSMTLGNHGWSGGIYHIKESTICRQLENLISKKMLSAIRLDNVHFFSRYKVEKTIKSKEMDDRLYKIHSS